jgi:hypothetical protein
MKNDNKEPKNFSLIFENNLTIYFYTLPSLISFSSSTICTYNNEKILHSLRAHIVEYREQESNMKKKLCNIMSAKASTEEEK